MATTHSAQPASGQERADQVQQIFSEIAPRYDLLNHVLSLNIDRRWRAKAIDRLGWEENPSGRFLDACAGTYDLSLQLAATRGFQGRVFASDFARPMLVQGLDKLGSATVYPVCGDTLRFPFPDGSFDGVTVGFGVRNLSDLEGGLKEFRRVLRPEAKLVVLEFTVPPGRLMRGLYMIYFTKILPVVGRIVSGHSWAYTYLPESVKGFPGPGRLGTMMEDAGFEEVSWTLLTGGIAAIHVGVKGAE